MDKIQETGPIGLKGLKGISQSAQAERDPFEIDIERVRALNSLNADNPSGYYNDALSSSTLDIGLQSLNSGFGNSVYDKENLNLGSLKDLNELRAQSQSAPLKLINGVAKGVGTFATTLLDTTIGGLYGLGRGTVNAITAKEGERGKAFTEGLWNNEINKALSDVQDQMEELLPNYYTNAQKNSEWYSAENLLSANFLGDKVIKNMGFTVGALAGMALTGGTGVVGAVGSGVGKIGKLAGLASKALGAGRKTQAAFNRLSKGMNNAAQFIVNNAIAANGEASIEAINTVKQYQKDVDNYINQKLKPLYDSLDPESPDYERRKAIIDNEAEKYRKQQEDIIRDAGNFVFGGNMAVLSLSNTVEFFNLMRGGFRNSSKLLGHEFTVNGERASAQEAMQALMKGQKVALANTENTSMGRAAALAGKDFMSEGWEEGSQNLVSNTADKQLIKRKDLADKLLLERRLDSFATQDVKDYTESMMEAWQEQFGTISAPGWEEVFLGGLTGGMGFFTLHNKVQKDENGKTQFDPKTGKPITKLRPTWAGGMYGEYQELKEQSQQNQQLIDKVNERLQDPEFINRCRHAVSSLAFENEMNQALQEGDAYAFKNSERDKLINDIFYFKDLGLIEDYKSIYKNIQAMSDEDFAVLYSATQDPEGKSPLDDQDINKTKQEYQDKAKKTLANIDKVLQYYDYVDSNYSDRSMDFKQELASLYMQLDDLQERERELEKQNNPIQAQLKDLGIEAVEPNTKEKEDLERIKKQKNRILSKINGINKDPQTLDNLIQMVYANVRETDKQTKEAKDIDFMLNMVNEAQDYDGIKKVFSKLGYVDSKEVGSILTELCKRATPENRKRLLAYNYLVSAMNTVNQNLVKKGDSSNVQIEELSKFVENAINDSNFDSKQVVQKIKDLYTKIEQAKNVSDLQDLEGSMPNVLKSIIADEQGNLKNSVQKELKDSISDIYDEFVDAVQQIAKWTDKLSKSTVAPTAETKKTETKKESSVLKDVEAPSTFNNKNVPDWAKDSKVFSKIFTSTNPNANDAVKQDILNNYKKEDNTYFGIPIKDIDYIFEKANLLGDETEDALIIFIDHFGTRLKEYEKQANKSESPKGRLATALYDYFQNGVHLDTVTDKNIDPAKKELLDKYIAQLDPQPSQNEIEEITNMFLEAFNAIITGDISAIVKSSNPQHKEILDYILSEISLPDNTNTVAKKDEEAIPVDNSIISLPMASPYNFAALRNNTLQMDSLPSDDLNMQGIILPIQKVIDNHLNKIVNKKKKIFAIKDPQRPKLIMAAIKVEGDINTLIPNDVRVTVEGEDGNQYAVVSILGYDNKKKGTKDTFSKIQAEFNQAALGTKAIIGPELRVTNIGDGRMIDHLPEGGTTNLYQLIEGNNQAVTNPFGITLSNLKFSIVYKSGLKKFRFGKNDNIQQATSVNPIADAGKVYVYIPTASGTYVRHEISKSKFSDINQDSNLYKNIESIIDDIFSNNAKTASIALKQILVLNKDREDIFVVKENDGSFTIKYKTALGGYNTFRSEVDGAKKKFKLLLQELNPNLNISYSVMNNESYLKDLADAGCLNLQSAVSLSHFGANVTYQLVTETKELKKEKRNTGTFDNIPITYINQSKYYYKDGEFYFGSEKIPSLSPLYKQLIMDPSALMSVDVTSKNMKTIVGDNIIALYMISQDSDEIAVKTGNNSYAVFRVSEYPKYLQAFLEGIEKKEIDQNIGEEDDDEEVVVSSTSVDFSGFDDDATQNQKDTPGQNNQEEDEDKEVILGSTSVSFLGFETNTESQQQPEQQKSDQNNNTSTSVDKKEVKDYDFNQIGVIFAQLGAMVDSDLIEHLYGQGDEEFMDGLDLEQILNKMNQKLSLSEVKTEQDAQRIIDQIKNCKL